MHKQNAQIEAYSLPHLAFLLHNLKAHSLDKHLIDIDD
jgi:hypothetical protein